MVVIPTGTFLVGVTEATELPIQQITISYPFAVSRHEVSSSEYQQFCDETE